MHPFFFDSSFVSFHFRPCKKSPVKCSSHTFNNYRAELAKFKVHCAPYLTYCEAFARHPSHLRAAPENARFGNSRVSTISQFLLVGH
jgi:hypothetical protein